MLEAKEGLHLSPHGLPLPASLSQSSHKERILMVKVMLSGFESDT